MPRKIPLPDLERQLMIKTKTCQRLIKEVAYYQKEVQENETKLQEMKQNHSIDPYNVKRFEQGVLAESYMMIPDSQKRLEGALEDLESFLHVEEKSLALNEEWLQTAIAILRDHGRSTTGLSPSADSDGDVVVESQVDDNIETY